MKVFINNYDEMIQYINKDLQQIDKTLDQGRKTMPNTKTNEIIHTN